MIPIASRTLTVAEQDEVHDVIVRLFMPDEVESGWSCAYEIGWPGRPRRFRAVGQDSVQAIQLAMQMIGAELYASDAHKDGKLALYGAGAGYGFPVARTLRDILEGDDERDFG